MPFSRPTRRTGSSFWIPCLCLVAVACAPVPPATAQWRTTALGVSPAMPAHDMLVRNGFAALQRNDLPTAERALGLAEAVATAAGDRWAVAEARRGRAACAARAGHLTQAEQLLDTALETFTALGDRHRQALVWRHQAVLANLRGQRERALHLVRQALTEFEAEGALDDAVSALRLEASLAEDRADGLQTVDRALAMAARGGLTGAQGGLLQDRGDTLFLRADFAGAAESYERAEGLLQQAGDLEGLGRLWTSMGRLHRAHGRHEAALGYYRRAYDALRATGDMMGVIQAVNAIATALGNLGRSAEAGAEYERALALAEKVGSPRVINFQRGNLGGHYSSMGNLDRAIPLLRESAEQESNEATKAHRMGQLGAALLQADEPAESLAVLNEAVVLMRRMNNQERLFHVLADRARAHQRLGTPDAALADVAESLAILEGARRRLPPSDFLKRGFNQYNQNVASLGIALLQDAGRHREAIEAAEQARARAFLDLLASRPSLGHTLLAPATAASASATAGTPGSTTAGDTGSAGPLMRGTAVAVAAAVPSATGTPALSAPASVTAATYDEVLAQARQRRTTVLSYWVAPDRTFVWAVQPDGTVTAASATVTDQRLAQLARAIWGGAGGPQPDHTTAAVLGRGKEAEALDAGAPLSPRRAARELFGLLITPVSRALPSAPGATLAIVPHGPLFRLSFAALLDPQGRYLVERFAIHYSPSVAALAFTKNMLDERAPRADDYLLVADPANMPSQAAGEPLPALPGSRDEVAGIAGGLRSDRTRTLVGDEAKESRVRDAARTAGVIHLATHGIVRDDDPLGSFLALGASGTDAATDGALTAEDIYTLRLEARLVVLSACRSGLGEVSADGIVGLTRAFFYAGAPAVVATLWDVADEPSAHLLRDFYRALPARGAASALRSAQLQMIRDLRARTVRVRSGNALPESPSYWAGFVVQGEP